MNVFDFDGTIYKGDSERDFFIYCLKKYPKTRRHLLPVGIYGLGYGLRIIKKDKFKQKFLSFVRYIDVDKAVKDFWETHERKIKKWYREKKQSSDVIISASPEFLLKDFCESMGVQSLMATVADKNTGKYEINCHGKEKVSRFYEAFPNAQIDEFYSDRYCDTPLAKESKKAYIVKGEKLKQWKHF